MAGDPRKTMTVDETAIELGISRNAAYEAVKRGEIPSIRIGRRLLIPKAAFDRMLAEGFAPPPPHPNAASDEWSGGPVVPGAHEI